MAATSNPSREHRAPGVAALSTSYLVKITSTDKSWIATAKTQGLGILQATYWQKLSAKVEVAAELQLSAMPPQREAITTIGAKYDLRAATFRAQLDSTGKVSAFLERRITPTFTFMTSGEIDHFKVLPAQPAPFCLADLARPPQNAAKFGVGVVVESWP